MKKHYVTFGQDHTHRVNGQTIDRDCVVVFDAENYIEGRTKAFILFGNKFFSDYHDMEWDETKLHYYPRGYIYLEV